MKIRPPTWLLEAMKLTQEDVRGRSSGLDIVFDSDFAPSHSIASAVGQPTGEIVGPKERPVFYNHHALDNLQGAIDICSKLGLPWLLCGLPLQFEKITEGDLNFIMPAAGKLAENLNEGGPEWLAVVCYMNWVLACHYSTIGSPAAKISHHVFLAGATARELELALLNEEHATRGRKNLAASKKGGDQRRGSLEPKTAAVLHEMRRLVDNGHSIARAAQLASEKGVGKSKGANQKLWYRHK